MEQKQLDELDESYFGEEFVDDDEEIKIEKVNAKPKSSKKTPKKTKTAKKTAKKEVSKKDTSASASASAVVKEPEVKSKMEINNDKEDNNKKEEVVKVEETTPPPINAPEPVDPWALDDEDETGLFKEVSTWKAITGIAVILLVLSLFTQGFNFSPEEVDKTNPLSLSDAEFKALTFVNENLLQAPFVASVEKSEELKNVFKVTLSLAGQEVDSFITKDGQFFFPQGFDTELLPDTSDNPTTAATIDLTDGTEDSGDESTDDSSLELDTELELVPDTTEDAVDDKEEVVEAEEPAAETTPEPETTPEIVPEPTPVETPPTASTEKLSVSYKKWNFVPQKMTVAKGSKVMLTFNSDDSNPSFVLPSFKLSIPQLGLEKEITGTTTVEFDASESGNLDLTCASCSGTQAIAMQGMIVVE